LLSDQGKDFLLFKQGHSQIQGFWLVHVGVTRD
jgi:hypothetical protein